MLDLESRDWGSIPTRGGVIFCFNFYNPNQHNIVRSDRIRFKTKNPINAERKPDLRRKTGRMWIPIIQHFCTYIQRTRGWESDWYE